jgi:hypothetical protein
MRFRVTAKDDILNANGDMKFSHANAKMIVKKA